MNFKSLLGKIISTSTAEYKVEKLLGSGTFGAVALCSKNPSGEKVAIKFIVDRKSIEKAEEEANILHELKESGSEEHHIVHFNDSFMFQGHFCLEFENLDTDLFNFCDQRPLTLHQIRPIIKQVAGALCFLDDMGIVHADLKPENIMMVDRRRQPLKIRIIDFGLAVRKPVEWTGKQLQTLAFAAPEVLLGAPLSEAIDVWSVGCIAAELLLGRTLFKADYEDDLMHLIVSTIGMPTKADLDVGLHTKTLFRKSSNVWILKAAGSKRRGNSSPSSPIGLDAILKLPKRPKAEEAVTAECDRVSFVDLVTKMLEMDPRLRITPKDILRHPFITMDHLTGLYSSYLESSMELMKVCCTEGQPAAPTSMEQLAVQADSSSGPESSSSSSSKRSRDHSEDSQSPCSRLKISRPGMCDPMEGPSTTRKKSDPMKGPSKKRRRSRAPSAETSCQARSEPAMEPSSPRKRKRKRSKASEEPSSPRKRSEPAEEPSSLRKRKRKRSKASEEPSSQTTKKSEPPEEPSSQTTKRTEPPEEPFSQTTKKSETSGETSCPKRKRIEPSVEPSIRNRAKT